MLFLANEPMRQLLSPINVSLVGDPAARGKDLGQALHSDGGYAGFCITPMEDADRIALALLSPLIAFSLLALLALIDDFIWRCALWHSMHATVDTRWSARLYCLLCIVRAPACGTRTDQRPPLTIGLLLLRARQCSAQ